MTPDRRRSVGSVAPRAFALAASVALVAGSAAAHTGSLGGASRQALAVPTWLFLLTGGGVVGASFLLASFVTDRRFLRSVHAWGRTAPIASVADAGRVLGRLVGLVGLGAVLYFGFTSLTLFGVATPVTSYRNLAILLVWVAWWGGYVATTYLVGDTWPALNPFRTLAEALPSLDREYPERLGAWPSVAGILALVWVEVTSPLADDPDLLAGVVAAYGAVTLLGAAAFGTDRWFGTVDPVARLFRYYGHVAPVHRTDGGLRLRLPGSGLTGERLVTGRDEVAFVVAILFVTTFDGFVATGVWAGFARAVVGAGVPAPAVYLGAYLGGFAAFYWAFVRAARSARRTAETYLAPGYLARRFAPPLLAIAAGYHLAHNLGTFLVLLPTLLAVAASPASPPQNPPQLAGLPAWFGGLELAFVLVAHLLAVWVAHGIAYDLFPGRVQAVKSQYGVTLVMVCYTMLSLWIVSEPFVPPPFVAS